MSLLSKKEKSREKPSMKKRKRTKQSKSKKTRKRNWSEMSDEKEIEMLFKLHDTDYDSEDNDISSLRAADSSSSSETDSDYFSCSYSGQDDSEEKNVFDTVIKTEREDDDYNEDDRDISSSAALTPTFAAATSSSSTRGKSKKSRKDSAVTDLDMYETAADESDDDADDELDNNDDDILGYLARISRSSARNKEEYGIDAIDVHAKENDSDKMPERKKQLRKKTETQMTYDDEIFDTDSAEMNADRDNMSIDVRNDIISETNDNGNLNDAENLFRIRQLVWNLNDEVETGYLSI